MSITISIKTDDARAEPLVFKFLAQITKLKIAFTVAMAPDNTPPDETLEVKAEPSLHNQAGSSTLESPNNGSSANHRHITCSAFTKRSKGKELCRKPTSKDYQTGISFDSRFKDGTPSTALVICKMHLKIALEYQKGFGVPGMDWIDFAKFIPDYLSPETKLELKLKMISSLWSNATSYGNIYVFEIPDYMDDAITYKIGRSDNPLERRKQLEKQCCPRKYEPAGMWPFNSEETIDPKDYYRLTTTPLVSGKGVRWLESLVHHEIADLVKYSQYLNPDFPEVSFEATQSSWTARPGMITRSQRNPTSHFREMRKVAEPCKSCHVRHHEIFSLPISQYPHEAKGTPFEFIIKPIIQRWGEFVSKFD